MKKMQKKLLASAVALSALASVALTPVAHAEVSASVGVSNMYYWRGFDLGGGAALTGDLNYSAGGFTAGLWTSSGDSVLGTEYDLYVGYAAEIGDFSFGVSVVSYNYANPVGGYVDFDAEEVVGWEPVDPGDYVEVVPFVGYGPFTLTYYAAINADHDYFSDDYSYVTADLSFEKFGIKYGQHFDEGGLDGVSHIDITYKFNDNLSFTLGQIIDDADGAAPDKTNFIVTLSLPIL